MKKFKDTDMQLLLGQVLRAGTVISISIVFLGGVLYLYRHGQTIEDYRVFKGIPPFVQHASGLFYGALAFKGQAHYTNWHYFINCHACVKGIMLGNRVCARKGLSLYGH